MDKIKSYLLNNIEVLVEVAREINSNDGSLDYLVAEYNDEDFFDTFFTRPIEVARAISFGDYRYSDEFVRFNGYGNLESLSDYEYKEELENSIDDIVDSLLENETNLYLDDELQKLVNEAKK